MLISIKEKINRHLSNIPGWRTNRKIIVIESDDWGSIRMSSKKAFKNLKEAGIAVDKNHYNTNDGLESNEDLQFLMEVLSSHKDKTGRPPVITGANIVANPDFEKIKAHDFTEYFYEPVIETCKRYPTHDKILALWNTGIKDRLLVPEFHGREHLNTQRWLKSLQIGCEATHLAFVNGVTGISKGMAGENLPKYQAAFDIDTIEDLDYQKEVIQTGTDIFEQLYGYRAKFFIPTNGPFNNILEETVKACGIDYLGTGKIQVEPLGNDRYKKHFRYLGKQENGLTYLTRNCFFEPNSSKYSSSKDWVNDCLKEIEIAFKWNKPATISTHRVNYIGWLNSDNRDNGLKKLEQLLKQILIKWPKIEFLTTSELGEIIKKSRMKS